MDPILQAILFCLEQAKHGPNRAAAQGHIDAVTAELASQAKEQTGPVLVPSEGTDEEETHA